MSSFLILGREASVAFAEVFRCLGQDKIVHYGREAVIIKDADFGKKAAQALGGVPKSGTILRTGDELSAELLADILRPYIAVGRKFNFGISVYGLANKIPSPFKGEGRVRVGLSIKKILKQSGQSVRLVESKSGNLSSVDVVKNKLLAGGVELCIFVTDNGCLIGKTEAVQPFEDYSRRDYGRPARDPKSGMLPPKLAKMMINMATGNRRGLCLLDPFCGSGTILQEALLMGHSCLGVDIESRAVMASKKNLEWLASQYHGLPSWQVEQADARQIGGLVKPKSVDVIVSEFHLGPPLSGRESASAIQSIARELSALYGAALSSLAPVLKDDGQAVLVWPYFKKHDVFISAFNDLGRLGWKVQEPYPAKYQKIFPLSCRDTLLYGRSDQRLWREILVLRKK